MISDLTCQLVLQLLILLVLAVTFVEGEGGLSLFGLGHAFFFNSASSLHVLLLQILVPRFHRAFGKFIGAIAACRVHHFFHLFGAKISFEFLSPDRRTFLETIGL
jgi:hypothetical protein